jgi:hypothetical protein
MSSRKLSRWKNRTDPQHRCMMLDPREDSFMRTTLVIDDDILAAAKAIAHQNQQTIGKVISDLARSSLHPPTASVRRNGVPLLPVRNRAVVTSEIVNALRDGLP